jgi:hypothetical protein
VDQLGSQFAAATGRPAGPPVESIPGRIVVMSPGGTVECSVEPGRTIVVGSDPGCDLVLPGNTVSARQTVIERLGPGWLVCPVLVADPTWLLDETGRAYPLTREIGLNCGELVVGGVHLLLLPPGT